VGQRDDEFFVHTLAGLCAAYELSGLGYDVVVYEARNRVGGRVERVVDFAKGKLAEGVESLLVATIPFRIHTIITLILPSPM
jgi:protoporphyrinogen oxidase